MRPTKHFALLLAVAGLAALPAGAHAQGSERGSTPPGMSQDGSRPSEGAIRGGSIQPGEQSGMPQNRALRRCDDLQGVLREQCLRELESASGGASRAPQPAVPEVVDREPRSAPPPQNPR